MKNVTLALSILCIAISAGYAQNPDNAVAQPTHVVGRSFNSAGEVTKELVSDFTYLEDGKLSRYEFPQYVITANFYYTGDYLTEETVLHDGGEHSFFERNRFDYENGQLMMVSHLNGIGLDQYWVYSYYSDGRLKRIESGFDSDEYDVYWHYDYEDNGHTVVESYYTLGLDPGWFLIEKKTSQFDDDYRISCETVEQYDLSGVLTSTNRNNYSYTENNLLSECVKQTLDNETWTNTSITRYVRDDNGSLIEILDGSWDTETADWNYSNKITFETSENGETYTVSFYKKAGDSWVWDIFLGQKVFFDDFLKPQQRMLTYMAYETGFGIGNINQIEFTLEWMNEPVYLDVNSATEQAARVYPNPGNEQLRIETSVERAMLHVYDAQGKLVFTQSFGFDTVVPTNDWAKGVYVWEVWDGQNKVAVGKWVKQ